MADHNDLDLDACREVARTCPRTALQRVSHAVGRRFQKAYDEHGISGQQFSLMVTISLHPEPSVMRLAKVRRLDQTTITRNIQVMNELGLVSTEPSKEDRRVRVIQLTKEGRRTLNAALTSWREVLREFVEQVGPERTEQLLTLSREVLEHLDSSSTQEIGVPH